MTTQEEHENLLGEQIAYYRARAAEYDEWFYRKGRSFSLGMSYSL